MYRKKFPLVAVYDNPFVEPAVKIFEAHGAVFSQSWRGSTRKCGLEYGVPAGKVKACVTALKGAGYKTVTDQKEIERRHRKFLETL